MSSLYNLNMTSTEARMTFFKVIEGKTKEERAALYEEYDPYASAIYKKEAELADQGIWICG